jgi:hypothetical protein
MRELTSEAAAIAAGLGGATLLRDHGGGFSPAIVALHRISAEYSIGEPGAAIAVARQIPPASLPSVERRARYYADVARAFGQWGRRDDCLNALLAAERQAPEETHTRPAVRDLIYGLLVSGRTAPELRSRGTVRHRLKSQSPKLSTRRRGQGVRCKSGAAPGRTANRDTGRPVRPGLATLPPMCSVPTLIPHACLR